MKGVVVLILIVSLMLSGCINEEQHEVTATPTLYPAQTPTIQATVEQTSTPVPAVEQTSMPISAGEPQKYFIKIDEAIFLPLGDLEIDVGDTVVWRNLETHKRPHFLVSQNGLWDGPQNLLYARSIEYTFNETGTYTFYLQGYERRKMLVFVT